MLLMVTCAAVAIILVALPKFNAWQFQDDVSAVAKFESGRPDEEIRALVMKKAKDHDVDIKPDDIMISRENAMLTITIDYSVEVDLKVKQITLDFHIQGPPKN